MSKVLFLGVPSHGHINPTLGLVSELVKQSEAVTYFASASFKEKIEQTGAQFKSYNHDLNLFRMEAEGEEDPFLSVMRNAEWIIDDILDQTKHIKFDYIIHSVAFPFTKVIAQVLHLPTVSSLAIFAGMKEFFNEDEEAPMFAGMEEWAIAYKNMAERLNNKYHVQMPGNMMHLMFNKGLINFVYTSEYFISPVDREFFDATYKFVGPPVFERKEELDFPLEQLQGKKVIYISLGTVFGSFNKNLYPVFFEAFEGMDAVVVMAAYNVDLSGFSIPANFMVRNYVPQTALLKYTSAAVTHAGMNSMSDLIFHHVPFVALPLGADQPALGQRAEELGAAIALDANKLTAKQLRSAVEEVMNKPSYLDNIKKINASFNAAGGYPKAIAEIFKMKAELGIE